VRSPSPESIPTDGSSQLPLDVEGMARCLLEAERDRAPIAPLTERHPALSIADAYAIQRAGLELRRARGARLVGRKVGLTSAAMQQMLGVNEPDLGYLTDDLMLECGASLRGGELIAPRVEAEIALRLRAPLRGPSVTTDEVLAATDAVAPALEVIDSRIADWRITIADTIADNASCGRIVLGAFRPLGALELTDIEMELTVSSVGEREIVTGRGDAVLGHPARAIAWLTGALHEHGDGLDAGEVVLPGAMGRALPIGAGARASARFTDVGEVFVSFA
jgi:2-keto-4-pentenoate hydratase